jgi:hypothetical protein
MPAREETPAMPGDPQTAQLADGQLRSARLQKRNAICTDKI